jgi:ParB family chromosome partitioning protein
MAGLRTVTAIVDDGLVDSAEILAAQLVENCLREDLKPIEQARAYRRLMDLQGWSGTRLAAELAIAQGTVSRALSLLDLPLPVIEHVESGQLAPSLAHEVAKLDSPAAQVQVAENAIAQKLTRQEVRQAVRLETENQAQRPIKAATRLKREIRVEGDAVVTVSLPAGQACGDDAILAALDAARRKLVSEVKKRRRDEAA